MLGEVYDDNGTLKIRTLSGAANDGGLPVGSVFGIHSTIVPAGYLPCNGAQYDTAQYPALYAILSSDHLPDLRESVLVGTGLSDNDYDEVTNPTGIHAHDVYTVGQFKDDQVENMPNGLITGSLDTFTTAEGVVLSEIAGNAPSDRAWRTGTTTHGKQYGINYIIKATTGTVQIADPEIIALIENWADMRFSATDRTNAYNNCLFRYDVINDTLVPLIKPSTNNTVLTASVTAGQVHNHNIYEMGGTYYLGSLQPTIQPIGELSSQTSVGYVVVASNDKWYTTDEISSVTYWFEVTSMLNGAFVYDINLPVTDSDLIDELNAATAQEVMYQTWSYQEETDIDYSWEAPVDKVGDLTTLTTTNKTDAVSAINEVNAEADTNATNIGDLTQLTTTDKSDLVAAVNEVAASSAGNPIGTIIEVADASVIPAGYLLADGRDTTGTADELSTHHPELYAYLGNSNVLPRATSEAPDWTNLTQVVLNSTTPYNVTEDGWMILGFAGITGNLWVKVNNNTVANPYGVANAWADSDLTFVRVSPGDVVTSNAQPGKRDFIPLKTATNKFIRG